MTAAKNDLARVREVLSPRRDELMTRWPGVVGTGIGHSKPGSSPAPEDDGWQIVVYLASEGDRPDEPVEIEGVPVVFRVTGRFTAQRARL